MMYSNGGNEIRSGSNEVCRFYQAGYCINGPSCPFLHVDSPEIAKPVASMPVGRSEGKSPTLQSPLRSSPGDSGGVEGIVFKSNTQNVINGSREAIPNSLPVFNIIPRATAKAKTTPSRVSTSAASADTPLCSYHMQGSCRYGDKCRFIHGIPCPICGRNALHPVSTEQRNEHLRVCTSSKTKPVTVEKEKMETKSEETPKCEICNKNMDNRVGLLSDCPHYFCLQCVREYRTKSTDTVRNCPTCQKPSYFIIPSDVIPESETHKQQIVDGYKKRLSLIPCKYFKNGEAQCPFGSACFYGHFNKKGERIDEEEEERKVMFSGDSADIKKTVTLSDFIP